MGFWHAIVLHILTMPLDIIVVLGLSIWGSAVLNQDGTQSCRNSTSCSPFASIVKFEVVLGYSYILFCIFVKPIFLGMFCFCCCGMRWMHQDEMEEKDWQVRSLGSHVIHGFRSGTFSSLYT